MHTLDDDSTVTAKISHIMDKLCYDETRSFLRVSEKKEGTKGNDPAQLGKVQELLGLVNTQFAKHYKPEEFLVVDESRVTYKHKQKDGKGAKRWFKEYVVPR
jgi:hypothetical protein